MSNGEDLDRKVAEASTYTVALKVDAILEAVRGLQKGQEVEDVKRANRDREISAMKGTLEDHSYRLEHIEAKLDKHVAYTDGYQEPCDACIRWRKWFVATGEVLTAWRVPLAIIAALIAAGFGIKIIPWTAVQ